MKSSLSGGDYIGGIIGSGKESSVVTGCVTLVDIKEFGRYCGAVSGTETGEFSENHYVSDTLAGLGRISYEGKAEPMSFYELSQLDGIPKEMTLFTLSFVIDDEKVKTLPFFTEILLRMISSRIFPQKKDTILIGIQTT